MNTGNSLCFRAPTYRPDGLQVSIPVADSGRLRPYRINRTEKTIAATAIASAPTLPLGGSQFPAMVSPPGVASRTPNVAAVSLTYA